MTSVRYRKDGTKQLVEEVQVSFNIDGDVLSVEIFNDVVDAWTPIKLDAMTTPRDFRAAVHFFVAEQLETILHERKLERIAK